MRISTKGRYALRLMLDIALNSKDGIPVRVKDIAKRQEISGKYLEQIIAILNKAGFVEMAGKENFCSNIEESLERAEKLIQI